MAVKNEIVEYILEQLSELEGVTSKKMFGGIGIFKDGKMFGMIDGNSIFRLKVDATNQADFEEAGMQPFMSKKKGKGMPYWEVPPHVLEDKNELAKWAGRSHDIAMGK